MTWINAFQPAIALSISGICFWQLSNTPTFTWKKNRTGKQTCMLVILWHNGKQTTRSLWTQNSHRFIRFYVLNLPASKLWYLKLLRESWNLKSKSSALGNIFFSINQSVFIIQMSSDQKHDVLWRLFMMTTMMTAALWVWAIKILNKYFPHKICKNGIFSRIFRFKYLYCTRARWAHKLFSNNYSIYRKASSEW